MRSALSSTTREGAVWGVLAGAVFGLAEVVGAAAMGQSPLLPPRMAASLVLGGIALFSTPPATAVALGLFVHLLLSALFGIIFSARNAPMPPEMRASWGSQAAFGLFYGLIVWLFDFQLVGRLLYPWFLTSAQIPQAIAHIVFFGLPLGLGFAATERRGLAVGGGPVPRPT
ncbi:MAG TPA: hypothetical protein VGQ83_37970 [Polyangia bacterium]|jgi:hypothetical protein